jgi:hypothetical protein
MAELSGSSPISPRLKTLDWTSWVSPDYRSRIEGGGYGEVYMGRWRNFPIAIVAPSVVIKVIRTTGQSQREINKQYKVHHFRDFE